MNAIKGLIPSKLRRLLLDHSGITELRERVDQLENRIYQQDGRGSRARDTVLDDELPYDAKLREFEKNNKILKRVDIYGSGPPNQFPSDEVLRHIKKYAKNSILDVGCGTGAYIKALNKSGYECAGVEYNQAYVTECLKQNLAVQYMDGKALTFSDNTFDTVMMIEVLEHIPEPLPALQEAFRVARYNVIISVPNIDVLPIMSKYQVVPWHMLEGTHLNFFTPKILESTLKQYASTIEIFTYGSFASWITEQQMYMNIFAVGYK